MPDFKRFSLGPIVGRHYAGLVAPGRTTLSITAIFFFFICPVVAAAASIRFSFGLPSSAIAPLLTGTGLLCGAFLSVFVLLTNLRIKVDETPKWTYKTSLIKVIANTAASTLYSASVAFGLVAVLVLGVSMPPAWASVLHVAGTGIVAAIALHLGSCFLVVVRRLYGVYFAMFKSDYDPVLKIVTSIDKRDTA